MTNLENLSRSEIVQLIGKLTMGWNVSYTNYDRQQIITTIQTNPYIGAILNKIGNAAANVNTMIGVTVEDEFEEMKGSELDQILSHPSPVMSLKEFKRNSCILFKSFGECFIYFDRYELGGNNNGKIIPGTIYLVPPELVDIKHKNLIPTDYVISGDFNRTVKPENIIHLKTFNPKYDDLHGLSQIRVAGILIDKLLAANDTETKTFQNSGPAYLVSAKETDSFTPEEYTTFMQKLKAAWRKITNKQGIVGTSGSVDVQPIGLSPSAMGTIESQKATTRILLVLWGLDPGLFDTEASTYNNKQTMEKSIYTEAAIPFIEDLIEKMNDRFEPIYKMKIVTDTSGIEVLQPNMKEKVDWMTSAQIFTDNQMLEALGYDRRESKISDTTPNERMAGESIAGFGPDVEDEIVQTVNTDIQATALNGAQISSLLEVINSMATGQIPTETGRAMIEAAFPTLTQEVINRIVSGLSRFKPKEPQV